MPRLRPERRAMLSIFAPQRSQRWPEGRPPPPEKAPMLLPAGLGLAPGTALATMGSCFASEVRTWLSSRGCRVLGLGPEGLDPPRPIFNPASLRQEAERAFGRFEPVERFWWTSKGRQEFLLDPYLHNAAFASISEAETALRDYRADLAETFRKADLIFLTLGLAECWQSKKDFAVFSAVPPVDVFDPARHGPALLSAVEAENHLHRTVSLLLRNGRGKIVLTVSPIPLLATFRKIPAGMADRESKAILRMAAVDVAEAFRGQVYYFPSFEIIRSLGRRAWMKDGRHVSRWGVAQVMRQFERWAA